MGVKKFPKKGHAKGMEKRKGKHGTSVNKSKKVNKFKKPPRKQPIEGADQRRKQRPGKSKFQKGNKLTETPRKKPVVESDYREDDIERESDDMDVQSSSDSEQKYEKAPRGGKTFKVRNLLPVKEKNKLVFRSEVVRPEESEEEEIDEETERPEVKAKTLVENYALQKQSLADLKQKVALVCTSVIEEPENNIKALAALVSALQNPVTEMVISEKKILSLSLLHVFSDILPGYRLRGQEEMDSKVKLKKDTRKLLGYEQTLLKCYRKYLDLLYDMIRGMRVKSHSDLEKKAAAEIGKVALKCMCELLHTRFSFNYFKNIANKLVPLSFDGDEGVTEMCCCAFEKLFKADKKGEASYDLVNQIVNVLKERKFIIPTAVLRTFLALNLREAKAEVTKIDMKKGRKEWQAMSKTKRKDKKKMKELEAELKEAQAYESVETVKKFHTSTLNKIFWVFFHILKDGNQLLLVGPALEGLSKFAWLINLEFYDDLNSVLCSMMENGLLSDVEKLHGVYTLFTILAGQAEALHIDPHKIYCHMYQGLLNLGYSTDVEHFDLTLKCLEFNVVRKKKKISNDRILAFTKRICTVCLKTPMHGTLGLLSSVRNIINNIKTTDILLDPESTIGSGNYLPEIEDPEHCCAQSSALWELHLLRRHYSPIIRLFALHLLNKCPSQGKLVLPDKLASMQPEEILHLFAEVDVKNKMDFLEDAREPPKKKFKLGGITSKLSYEDSVDLELDCEILDDAQFFS